MILGDSMGAVGKGAQELRGRDRVGNCRGHMLLCARELTPCELLSSLMAAQKSSLHNWQKALMTASLPWPFVGRTAQLGPLEAHHLSHTAKPRIESQTIRDIPQQRETPGKGTGYG